MTTPPERADIGPGTRQPVTPEAWIWRALLGVLIAAVCWLAFTPNPPPQADTGWDKLNHLLAFSALGGCAWFGWAGSVRRMHGVPAGLIAFGGFIELVQTRIPGRSGEWPDLLADSLGIAAGLALGLAIERLRQRAAVRRQAG